MTETAARPQEKPERTTPVTSPVTSPVAAPVTSPVTAPVVTPVATQSTFDWEGFLARVRELNDAVCSQLARAKYEYAGGILTIYPARKIAQMILTKENNLRILAEAAGVVKITVGSPDGQPKMVAEDELIAKMSGIMGGEVLNDGGGSPF